VSASLIACLIARDKESLFTEIVGPTRWSFYFKYKPPWRLVWACFIAGAILLALEVVWFRFLRLFVAASATAFAIMLAVVLAGIGVGGLAAGAIYRGGREPRWIVPLISMLSAIATLLCYVFFPIQL